MGLNTPSTKPHRPATFAAVCFACFVAIACATMPAVHASGENMAPAAGPTEATQYKRGKTSFRKRCARCHGVNMNNPGVGVFDLRTFPPGDKARFVDSVSNGKNAMPSWGAVLKPQDIDVLWLYVSNTPR
jgi:mono/diheme cytochrome c family protein